MPRCGGRRRCDAIPTRICKTKSSRAWWMGRTRRCRCVSYSKVTVVADVRRYAAVLLHRHKLERGGATLVVLVARPAAFRVDGTVLLLEAPQQQGACGGCGAMRNGATQRRRVNTYEYKNWRQSAPLRQAITKGGEAGHGVPPTR